MNTKMLALALGAVLSIFAGCAPLAPSGDNGRAVIVGQIASNSQTAKLLAAAQANGDCPELLIMLDGTPVTVEFAEDCSFVITDIAPAALVALRVEVVDLGVAGTVELADVLADELIEIVVEPTDVSLSVSVERRLTPEPVDTLPTIIDGNNVSIRAPAGTFATGLEVDGNKFTLIGVAGDDCDDTAGWTVIEGAVVIDGNKATLQNIYFAGPVQLRGNKPLFINCCFGDGFEVFGNGSRFADDDDDDDFGDDEDDD
ncbi:MAG: hypothetical protein AB7N71_00640 [Phycisphaerae bacterium]